MSIFYMVGKPRGGKSYMAVKAICDELCNKQSHRDIVTNLPLKFDDYERQITKMPSARALWRWRLWGRWKREAKPVPEKTMRPAKGLKSFCSEYAPHVKSVEQRIRILEDNETGEFWLYEPGWTYEGRVKVTINRKGTEVDYPDFSYKDGTKRGDENVGNYGTLYVIDEVHLFFPSRAWQRTGEDATFFLSQHGKLKCDVIMVTQHPEQCDKALRRLAQEYMTVRNLSREPIMGFRLGNWFRVNRMLNSPSSPNPYIFDSAFVGMEWEKYGDLYDTSAGVGVAGTLVPNNERKGRSLWWLLVPVLVAVLFFANIKRIGHWWEEMCGMLISQGVNSMMHTPVNGPKKMTPPNTAASASVPVFVASSHAEKSNSDSMPVAMLQPVTKNDNCTNVVAVVCTGFLHWGSWWQAYLSNGQTFSSDAGDSVVLRSRTIQLNGVDYRRQSEVVANETALKTVLPTHGSNAFPYPESHPKTTGVTIIPFDSLPDRPAQISGVQNQMNTRYSDQLLQQSPTRQE